MKRFLVIFISILFSFFVISCDKKNDINLESVVIPKTLSSISTSVDNGVLVGVSDPHMYTKKGPKAISGSFYFNPMSFYNFNGDISIFSKSYSNSFENKKVYYYDENDGAQAGIVVYVLRNLFDKKNVSLVINSKLKSQMKFGQKLFSIDRVLSGNKQNISNSYIGTGKILIVYNIDNLEIGTGDLLLYSSDKGTMINDKFYNDNKNLNIKNLYWSLLIDISGNLKNDYINQKIKELELSKYSKIYIYYPKYWYRSGILALILEEKLK